MLKNIMEIKRFERKKIPVYKLLRVENETNMLKKSPLYTYMYVCAKN